MFSENTNMVPSCTVSVLTGIVPSKGFMNLLIHASQPNFKGSPGPSMNHLGTYVHTSN